MANKKKSSSKKTETKKVETKIEKKVVEVKETTKEKKKKYFSEDGLDRKALKEDAKKLIEGNKWHIWKPQVYFNLIVFAILFVIFLIFILCGIKDKELEVLSTSLSSIVSFVETFFMFGYAKYCLDFTRGKIDDWKEPFRFAKDHLLLIFLVDLVMSLNVAIGIILLIVPGIIAAVGLSFTQEVFADNTDLGVKEILKKSWETTYGHKMELFILGLSFLGWTILAAFTLGILFIWLYPYMTVTYLLAYEELRKTA